MPSSSSQKRKNRGTSRNRGGSGDDVGATATTPTTDKAKQQHAFQRGYVMECDIPTMQYIQNLENSMRRKPRERVFILSQLDSTHCFIKSTYKDFVNRKVEEWLDGNVFSSVERLGEDFDIS